MSQLEATTFITFDLEAGRKEELIKCLRRNHDVFAWSTHELQGISPSIAQHELHVRSDAWLVKRRKRDFSAEQNVIIRAEIEKLLGVGHIREGYHQVPLARGDQEKIGRNLEVYVDDILIKSLRATDLSVDIEETFQTLRTYGIKLNPQKYQFGAKSGRFLGYIVTDRDIEANPSKVKALQDMPPPRNLKEVQRLTAKLTIGEPLRIYLSSSKHVVGSALVRSDGEKQPVYFLNHILKDAESHYNGLEKLAFPLILAARRLRPYFLAHTIVVMTNSPLGRYQPRTAIKAQSLADFVTKVQTPEPGATWKVYVDGSSTRQGSDIDILLISPQEERMHLSVRLDYRATNNEAEYEALIAGLRAARHVGASKVSLVSHIDKIEGLVFPSDWRMVIVEFLQSRATSSDREEAQLLRKRAGRFTLIGDQLYKKAFSKPLLKCVSSEDAEYILQEVHQGAWEGHPNGRSLARKIPLAGYFWPTLQEDAARTVVTCHSRQKYHNFSHQPTEEMKVSTVSCPFDQWDMDIVGPFPMVTGQQKFLLVAVDYFSKSIEA
ncbi:uncharacterized protein LOC122043495 [Zingiber officinale]|uniref:uncharacterized protein LOC122043495 n=1 Tax=Zingiber officinale TaxID=94328 RepID=UPI001C4D969D|nr:uncharacterized protein LOC122043495 [Zingiber officinale]